MIEKLKLISLGVCIGIVICLIGYILMPKEKEEINIDEKVQREIDSSGFLDMDSDSRGRYLDSLAHIRTK